MKKIKVTATLILCAVALLLLLPGTAKAAQSGTCGENVTWTLDAAGTLTISGTGPMYDYTDTDLPWWCDNKNSVKKIIIEDGVTYIGDYAFCGMRVSYDGIRVPASVREVGEKAFSSVYGTIYFLGDPPIFAQDAFSSKTDACYYLSDWPESVTQNRYGGSIHWVKSKLFLRPEEKRFFALNEELTVDNLPLYTNGNSSTSARWSFRVEPRSLTFSNYDGNTTYGPKTVTVHADGYDLEYVYFVTDGQNHFDLLDVQYEKFIYAKSDIILPKVKVYLGTLQLEADKDFTYTYENVDKIGHNGKLTVTGKGIYEGFTKTYPVAVLKSDMAGQKINVGEQTFRCEPLYPKASVEGFYGNEEGQYYELLFENNTNVGQATAYVVGKGNSYGMGQANFYIKQDKTEVIVEGEKVGTADSGVTSDEIAYYEGWVMPGKFTLKIDINALHIAYYELYRVEGDDQKLVRTYESDVGYSYATGFSHDFSSVYDKQTDTGMEVYILTFTYLDINDDIRAGACVMYIPTKVYDGEHMELYLVENDGDFRAEYLGAYSEDGNLGVVEWESSDETIATVRKGAVTFKKPGTVTITGSYNDLSASKTVSMSALDITEGDIFDYDGAANVIYDGRILIYGTDYTLTATTNGDVTEVLVAGCGLFEGYLMRQFDAQGAPVGHTHSFDASCDETCGSCDFTRAAQHSFQDRWMKDALGHWHGCSVCGKQKDYENHTFSDAETCAVCGPLREPGDVNADGQPNTDDAVYLLLHVMFGNEDYPVEGGIHTDFNNDGKVDTNDAVYLLLNVMFGPEDYPISA